jgi:hypothetical protein
MSRRLEGWGDWSVTPENPSWASASFIELVDVLLKPIQKTLPENRLSVLVACNGLTASNRWISGKI